MPYWVTGNAAQLFSAFGYPQGIQKNNKDVLADDFAKVNFWGDSQQINTFCRIWHHHSVKNYAKGNISAEVLQHLLGEHPLKKEKEVISAYQEQYAVNHFAYVNKQQQACGLIVMYRRDEPSTWVVGLIKGTNLAPKDRAVTLLSSFDLQNKIKNPALGVKVELAALSEKFSLIGNPALEKLLAQAFAARPPSLHKHFARIRLLLRTPGDVGFETPVQLNELKPAQFLAENPVLDLMLKHNIDLEFNFSAALLNAYLTPESHFYKVITAIHWADNDEINKCMLKMAIIFERENLLKENQKLLANTAFVEAFSPLIGNSEQIQQLSFFHKKTYSLDFCRKILSDPGHLNAHKPAQFLAKNPVLALVIKHNIDLEFNFSSVLLNACVSPKSHFYKIITAIDWTDNEKINKCLLKMAIVFEQENVLKENQELLVNAEFVKAFSSFMWDREQIKLFPFFHKKAYPFDLCRKILSEPSHYRVVNRLIELGLTEDLPMLFANPQKISELTFIDKLSHEDCKSLCLIFWVKSDLTQEKYNDIVVETQKYPLLASTLIELDKHYVVDDGIDGLQQLVANPKEHLKESIMHHFFPNTMAEHYLNSLDNWEVAELDSASQALSILRDLGMTKDYRWVIEHQSHKGKALRIFLPQFAAIADPSMRRKFADILLKGVSSGITFQDNEVCHLNETLDNSCGSRLLVKSLFERLIHTIQIQKLGLPDPVTFLAAQENDIRAERFREIIAGVEAQCKLISSRLSEKKSYKKMKKQWVKHEENYRRCMYLNAFEALTKPEQMLNAKLKIRQAEHKILEILDPPLDSNIYQALIYLANFVITALSLGLANYIKGATTGNYWFFTQSKSGEEIRALGKQVNEQLLLQEPVLVP